VFPAAASNPVQETFDAAIECIQDSLVQDARTVHDFMRKGKHANADMIAFFRKQMARKLRALDFIMTQTGWQKTDQFHDRSPHWEDVLSNKMGPLITRTHRAA
jgi:hypothetical protein